jgi:integrase
MLRDHLAKALPGGNGPESLVFPSKTGQPLRHNLYYRPHFKLAVRGFTDKEGVYHPGALPERLHGLRYHDLRHTCAALSVAAGAHVKLISARLGHSSVQITLDRSAHLYPSVEEALGDALDTLYRAEPAAEKVVQLRP